MLKLPLKVSPKAEPFTLPAPAQPAHLWLQLPRHFMREIPGGHLI